jgi:hypothetical protein
MSNKLHFYIQPGTKSTVSLNYIFNGVSQHVKTLDFLTYYIGPLVWLMLIHYKHFANTGLNSKYYTLEIVDDFPLAIWHLLDTFENDDESEDSADLSDLCDGSKLTVELYYTDLLVMRVSIFSTTRISFILVSEFKSQINLDNPDECELALAIA